MKELIELSFWDTHIQRRFLIISKMAMKYASSTGSSLTPPTPNRSKKNSFLVSKLFPFLSGIKGPWTEPSSYRDREIGSDFLHNLNLLLTRPTLTGARNSWNFITVSPRAGKKSLSSFTRGWKTSFLGSSSLSFRLAAAAVFCCLL